MRADMQRARGFTLIELVIVTIVIGIMAAVLAPLMLSSLRAYDDTLGDVVVLDKLRYATERLAREIREVQSASGVYAFISPVNANGNSMAFTRTYYDASGNPSPPNVVTVGTNATTATCGALAPCVTLGYSNPAVTAVLTDELEVINGVPQLSFSYFASSGVAATSNTDVNIVQIDLKLSHNGNEYPQHTRVELKNN